MYCGKCGNPLREGAKFCGKCGTPVPVLSAPAGQVQPQTQARPVPAPINGQYAPYPPRQPAYAGAPAAGKKSSPLKILLPVLGGVLALILIAALLLSGVLGGLFGGGQYSYQKDSLRVDWQTDRVTENEVSVVSNRSGETCRLKEEAYWSLFSADGRKGYLYGEEAVWIVGYGFSVDKITDAYQNWVTPCYDGSRTVFLVEAIGSYEIVTRSSDGSTDALGWAEKPEDVYTVALSPTGKAVFLSFRDEATGEVKTGIWSDGKRRDIPELEGMSVSALSDDGKTVFCYDKNERFFVWTEKDGKTLLSDDAQNYRKSKYYNRDCTEALFMDGEFTKVYKDGAVETVTTGPCGLLLPDLTERFQFSTDAWEHFIGIKTFAGCFLTQDNDGKTDVYYLNKQLTIQSAIHGTECVGLANDGKTVVYLRGGSLYRVNGTKKNAEPQPLLDGGDQVTSFQMSPDGKTIYYTNGYDDLMMWKNGKSTFVKAFYDTFYLYSPFINMAGDTLYLVSDSVPYFVKDGMPHEITDYQGRFENLYTDGFTGFLNSEADGWEYVYRVRDGECTRVAEYKW